MGMKQSYKAGESLGRWAASGGRSRLSGDASYFLFKLSIPFIILGGAYYLYDISIGPSSKERKQVESVDTTRFYSIPEIRELKKTCKKLKNKENKKKCLGKAKGLIIQRKKTIKEKKKEKDQAIRIAKKRIRTCRKMKNSAGVKSYRSWIRKSNKWWSQFIKYSRKGVDHPGIELPQMPPSCQN